AASRASRSCSTSGKGTCAPRSTHMSPLGDQRTERTSADGEADLPAVLGRDLDVGDLRGADDVLAALLVDEPEQALAARQRGVDLRADLVRGLVAGHHELPRALHDADLDLHGDLLVVTS